MSLYDALQMWMAKIPRLGRYVYSSKSPIMYVVKDILCDV